MAAFEHINLNEVSTESELIPPADYNLKLTKVEKKTYDKTATGGNAGEYINFSVGITDDPNYTGRRVFQTLFPSKGMPKQLKRLMDATGIEPEGTFESLDAVVTWMESIRQAGATFSAPVTANPETDKRDGSSRPVNRINLFEVAPAQ